MRTTVKLLLVLAGLALAVTPAPADDGRPAFGLAVYKAGERLADDKHAGEAVDRLCTWLGANVAGARFERRGVRNQPADALALLQSKDNPVALAIISPAFFARHREALKLTTLAEARRGDTDGEQYTLVGAAKTETYPAGKRVATTLTAEREWLDRVVLPRPEGVNALQWVQMDNLFDAAFAIADGEKDAPDFVLVDRATLAALRKDDDLKALEASLQSEALPQDLVVEVDGRLGDKREAVKKALAALNEDEEGRKLGALLQTPRFPAHNDARLRAALAKFDAK
jgi:hypothetical protein